MQKHCIADTTFLLWFYGSFSIFLYLYCFSERSRACILAVKDNYPNVPFRPKAAELPGASRDVVSSDVRS